MARILCVEDKSDIRAETVDELDALPGDLLGEMAGSSVDDEENQSAHNTYDLES